MVHPMGRQALAVLGGLVILVLCVVAGSRSLGPAAGSKALESRLYAPCCYVGTLDSHESELARTLRAEIETRVRQGESSEGIQSDFVARYGEKVIAARTESSTRAMGLVLSLSALGIALWLALLFRRWLRPPAGEHLVLDKAAPRDELDARIDADLAQFDG